MQPHIITILISLTSQKLCGTHYTHYYYFLFNFQKGNITIMPLVQYSRLFLLRTYKLILRVILQIVLAIFLRNLVIIACGVMVMRHRLISLLRSLQFLRISSQPKKTKQLNMLITISRSFIFPLIESFQHSVTFVLSLRDLDRQCFLELWDYYYSST